MRHAIGTGTANLCINTPIDEKSIIGQAAFKAGAKSTGDFLRLLILEGLRRYDPDAAEKVADVRRRYYGGTLLVVFLAGWIAALLSGEGMDLRRCRTRTRTIEERMEEQCA